MSLGVSEFKCSKCIAWFSSIIFLPSRGPHSSNFSKWHHNLLNWTGELVFLKYTLPSQVWPAFWKSISLCTYFFSIIWFFLKVFIVAYICNLGILGIWTLGSWLWARPQQHSKSLPSFGYICLYNMTLQKCPWISSLKSVSSSAQQELLVDTGRGWNLLVIGQLGLHSKTCLKTITAITTTTLKAPLHSILLYSRLILMNFNERQLKELMSLHCICWLLDGMGISRVWWKWYHLDSMAMYRTGKKIHFSGWFWEW